MIRYSLYDPKNREYIGHMLKSKHVLEDYLFNLISNYDPEKFSEDSKYHRKYRKLQGYYSRLIIKKLKCTEV